MAESTNKNIIIIKRTIDQNQRKWHKTLIFALWANRMTQKASIATSPFNLVYVKEAIIPSHLSLPSITLEQFIEETSSSLKLRNSKILKIEEEREKSKLTHTKHQQMVKASFDASSITQRSFEVGDLVLKWDKAHEEKGKHTKFHKLWLGPFQIVE